MAIQCLRYLDYYDLTDVNRYCHTRDDTTARLGFKPKLGVLQ